jgi:hypothetical protein
VPESAQAACAAATFASGVALAQDGFGPEKDIDNSGQRNPGAFCLATEACGDAHPAACCKAPHCVSQFLTPATN